MTPSKSESEPNPVTKLAKSLTSGLTDLRTKAANVVADRRGQRRRALLLRQLGETTMAHHAAGANDYSEEMRNLIGELTELDPGVPDADPDGENA